MMVARMRRQHQEELAGLGDTLDGLRATVDDLSFVLQDNCILHCHVCTEYFSVADQISAFLAGRCCRCYRYACDDCQWYCEVCSDHVCNACPRFECADEYRCDLCKDDEVDEVDEDDDEDDEDDDEDDDKDDEVDD